MGNIDNNYDDDLNDVISKGGKEINKMKRESNDYFVPQKQQIMKLKTSNDYATYDIFYTKHHNI